MKKIFLATFLLLLGIIPFQSLRAQDGASPKYKISAGYGLAIPIGSIDRDYISKVGWRDFQVEFLYYVVPRVGVGLTTGWQYFNRMSDHATYNPYPGIDIYGSRFNFMTVVPILARADYVLTPSWPVIFSVGAGLGTDYVSQETEFGRYTFRESGMKFSWQGQIGIKLAVLQKLNVGFDVQYHGALNGIRIGTEKKTAEYIGIRLTFDFLGF